MTGRHRLRSLVVLGSLVVSLVGCAQLTAQDKAKQQASTVGKYRVRLTTDAESVEGTCKYVHSIQPDYDPVQIPTDEQLPEYYRIEGVLYGADTVLVRGRVGEAYICGPGPLNPDGTLKTIPPPAPQPTAARTR